jgi:NAD(P)-dependent dehydrogenase (short-subunit alcohol dehydrogenase family)
MSLTPEEQQTIDVASIAAAAETQKLLDIVERLRGKANVFDALTDFVRRLDASGLPSPDERLKHAAASASRATHSKEVIGGSYISRQKARHAHKRVRAEGRHALVTGAHGANIGGIIAGRLSQSMIVSAPTQRHLDVTMPGCLHRMHAGVDTLVLSHGTMSLDWIGETPDSRIDEIVQVNLIGTMRMVNEFVAATIEAPYAKYIVMIGSLAYNSVLNASAAYCASKAGLAMYARCAAWELAPKGFNVCAIHPGNTLGTPMTEKTIQELMRLHGLNRADAEAYWGAVLPKEQWLTTHDIADTVEFFVSGRADYLSGANIDMRGGQR